MSLINTYKLAIVLGNGKSRKDVDLQKLKVKGLLVGCNHLYTEIDPHIICALDEPMRKEILDENLEASFLGAIGEPYYDKKISRDMIRQNIKYAYKNGCINLDKAMENYPSCCYNSGVLALIITSWIENIKTIYMLGFDFFHSGNIPLNNNLYNGQYGKRPKYYENQINQVLSACNPDVKIIVVQHPGDEVFLNKLKIFKHITYDEFEET